MVGNPREIAKDAVGESVTIGRLTESVIDALGTDEQPHHILEGESVDYRPAEANEAERLFSQVETVVSLVVTAEQVLVVVPRAISNKVYRIEYDNISECSIETGQFPTVQLDTEEQTFSMNLSAGEKPEPVAAYIRRQRTADETGPAPTESAETPAEDRQVSSTEEESDDANSPLDRIERLAELHEEGVLTDEEFESKKQQLLDKV